MKMRFTVLALAMAVTPQTRAAINRAFRPDEFEIVWTATPAEAIEVSTRLQPNLVLLDLDRPVQTGSPILRSLRTINPDAPMVLLTEPSFAQDEKVAPAGLAVLHKPFGASVLAETATALLKSSGGETTPHISESVANSERFREMVLARYNTPFKLAPSYRHWGINE